MKLFLVTSVKTNKDVVKALGHPPAADFVKPRLNVEPRHRFAIARRRQIHGDLVASRDCTGGIHQGAVTFAFVVHHFVDLGFGCTDAWQLDSQAGITRNGNNWAHFDFTVKRNRAAVGFGAMHVLDLRRGDDVDVMLLDGFSQIFRYGVFDGLGPRGALAVVTEMRFNHPTWCFAWPKAWNANLARQLAVGHLDVLVERRFINRNVKFYFVAFERLNGALHESRRLQVPY